MMRPETEAELSALLAAARTPLAVRGGGTRGVRPGEVLDTTRLRGPLSHRPEALMLTAPAATPLAEITALLAGAGQRLEWEPPDFRALLGTAGSPTLGGSIAANDGGPRRFLRGAARDFVTGLSFVDGQGTRLRTGGQVMKNVTGLDLTRLLCGSRGRLGVITSVSVKVLPAPPEETTLHFPCPTAAAAAALFARAVASPLGVTGAAWLPAEARLGLRLEGAGADLARRAARLGSGAATLAGAESRAFWQAIRDVMPFAGQPGEVWRLSLRPSALEAAVAAAGGAALFADQAGGLVWLHQPEAEPAAIRAILTAAGGGHARALRGGTTLRDPDQAEVRRLEADIARRFDPRGIFAGTA